MPKPKRRNRRKKKGKKPEEKKEEEKVVVSSGQRKKKKGVDIGQPKPKVKPNKDLIARLRKNAKRMQKSGFKPKNRRNFSKRSSKGGKMSAASTKESQIEAKLNMAMKQLQGQEIGDVDEVKIIKGNGKIIEIESPKVTAAMNANTYLIVGEKKSQTEKKEEQQKEKEKKENEEIIEVEDDEEDENNKKEEKTDQKIEEIDDEEEDVILPEVESFDANDD